MNPNVELRRLVPGSQDSSPSVTLVRGPRTFHYPTDNLSRESLTDLKERSLEHLEPKLTPPSFLRHPFKYLHYLGLPVAQKPTGLEHVSLSDLMALKERTGAFEEARTSEILLRTPWNDLINPAFLRRTRSAPLTRYLKEELSGQNLIELGVGENVMAHRELFRRFFGVKHYTAVDQRAEVEALGGKKADILEYLSQQPSASANVVAFGVFNDPLSLTLGNSSAYLLPASSPARATRNHVQFEYLRRLARELARVVPPGGLLWGAGLHPLSHEDYFQGLLLAAGFNLDLRGHTNVEFAPRHNFGIRDPFFLRRARESAEQTAIRIDLANR